MKVGLKGFLFPQYPYRPLTLSKLPKVVLLEVKVLQHMTKLVAGFVVLAGSIMSIIYLQNSLIVIGILSFVGGVLAALNRIQLRLVRLEWEVGLHKESLEKLENVPTTLSNLNIMLTDLTGRLDRGEHIPMVERRKDDR